MALRLRRGTDAERLTIIPVEGELIYTTDLQELWIGNGLTVGGNKVGGIIPSNLSDLDDVSSQEPQINQVLKWNGTSWIASDENDTGVIEGSNYRINIVGDDSTVIVDVFNNTLTGNFVGNLSGNVVDQTSNIIVDTSTGTFTGTFIGDGSGLTNLPTGNGVVEGENYRINIVDDQNNLIVDSDTATITGTFVGDGSGLTNLPGISISSIFDLDDVFDVTEPVTNDLLIFDGVHFIPSKIQFIEGANSTIILNAQTNTFTGTFIGDGSGLTNVVADNGIAEGNNYKINILSNDGSTILLNSVTNTFNGSVFSEVSGVLVDAENGIIPAERVSGVASRIKRLLTENNESSPAANPSAQFLRIFDDSEPSVLLLSKSRGTSENLESVQSGDFLGSVAATAFDGNSYFSSSSIRFTVDSDGTLDTGVIPGKIEFITTNNAGISLVRASIDHVGTFRTSGIHLGSTSAPNGIPFYSLNNSNTNGNGARLLLGYSRGTINTPLAVESGDILHRIQFRGYDGTAYRDTARIKGIVDGPVSNGIVPTKLDFLTTNELGETESAMSMTSGHEVKIKKSLQLPVFDNNTERDSAIPSPEEGTLVFNKEGGTNKFQGYDGSSWVDLN